MKQYGYDSFKKQCRIIKSLCIGSIFLLCLVFASCSKTISTSENKKDTNTNSEDTNTNNEDTKQKLFRVFWGSVRAEDGILVLPFYILNVQSEVGCST